MKIKVKKVISCFGGVTLYPYHWYEAEQMKGEPMKFVRYNDTVKVAVSDKSIAQTVG